MRPSALAGALVAGLLVLSSSASAQDTKGLADGIIRVVRPLQHEDGGYGDGRLDTCRVLDLLSRSPRRYTELDGPFFRRAAGQVAGWEPGSTREAAAKLLALARCVTHPLRAARDATRADLLARPDALRDELALYALLATLPEDASWPPAGAAAPEADASPAARVLLAADPFQVPAPPVEDAAAWVSWARAARLRGVEPTEWPELPRPAPGADLHELLDDLELVVAVHGLSRPDVGPQDPVDTRAGFVSAPRSRADALDAALGYLAAHQVDGRFGLELPGWSGPEPGVTAMCLSAGIAAADERGVARPDWVEAGLDYLVSLQRPDGAIMEYGVAVYTTSAAVEALLDGGRPEDAGTIRRARDFLVSRQADEDLGYDDADDPHYGGIGYGGDERPDLSNTQMALEAVSRAGLPDDPSFVRKALVFLERNQNLAEVNTETWDRAGGGVLTAGNDGGATYMPGNSPAGEDEVAEGVWTARSYGSMTFALTKSYLLAGVDPDDERVRAAVGWIASHWTLDRNPGFTDRASGADGLYYYYLALARTLRLLPDGTLTADDGTPIPWRRELQDTLLAAQRTDGSWFNERAPRWYEGAPTLGTAYAVLALTAAGPGEDG